MSELTGLVVQNTGSLYLVKVGAERFMCKLKGNFKLNEIRTTNPVTVGDYVTFDLPEVDSPERLGWITRIEPRRNYIIRRSSNLSKQAHILGANLDRTLLVATVNYPVTSTTFIDRYLATAEAYRVEAAVVFNKIDRYQPRERLRMEEMIHTYVSVGYKCFPISARNGEGLDALRAYLSEGVSLISGHSGVGKSTLINALVPEAHLKTQEISDAHNTGMHTTTFSEMIPFGPKEKEAYLIDTPGIKGFGTIEFEKSKVGHYFPEIFRYAKECYFGNCTHTHEPKCAVQQAIKEGGIAESRYKSYLSILQDDEDDKYRL